MDWTLGFVCGFFLTGLAVHLGLLWVVVRRLSPGADFTGLHALLVSVAGWIVLAVTAPLDLVLPEPIASVGTVVAALATETAVLVWIADLPLRRAALAMAAWYGLQIALAVGLLALGFAVRRLV